jgi:hypothetical protein
MAERRVPTEAELLEMLSTLGTGFPFPVLGLGIPLWCSLFMLPWLDWQRALLKAYHDAVSAPDATADAKSDARERAVRMLKAYLDSTTSRPDYAKTLLSWQSDLMRAYVQMLDGVVRSFEQKTSA